MCIHSHAEFIAEARERLARSLKDAPAGTRRRQVLVVTSNHGQPFYSMEAEVLASASDAAGGSGSCINPMLVSAGVR